MTSTLIAVQERLFFFFFSRDCDSTLSICKNLLERHQSIGYRRGIALPPFSGLQTPTVDTYGTLGKTAQAIVQQLAEKRADKSSMP